MRASRYLLPVLVLLAAAVAVAWYLRNTLIERFSVPLLAAYGFRISDVSLDSLASRDATIGRLDLAHENGATIRIEDLSLPFRADSAGVRSWRAGSVRIVTAPAEDDQPPETAAWLERFLSVAHDLAGSDFSVDSLFVPPYPPVDDLHWVLAGETQALRATIDGFAFALAVAETGTGTHDLYLSTGGQDIAAVLTHEPAGYRLAGTTLTDLPPWMPIAARMGLLPDDITVDAGSAAIGFDLQVPFAAGAAIDLGGTLVPTTPLQLTYASDGSEISATVMPSDSPFEFGATLPGSDWRVERPSTALAVDAGRWRDVRLQIDDLGCRAGPACSLAVSADVPAASMPAGVADRIEISGRLQLGVGPDGTRLELLPDARLHVDGLAITDHPVGQLEATLVSPARVDAGESAWTATADSIDASVDGAMLSDGVSLSLPLYLERITLGGGDSLSLQAGIYAPSSRLSLQDTVVSAPGLRGDIKVKGDTIDANLTTVGLFRDAAVRIHHEMAAGAGRVAVEEAQVSFAARALAERFRPWPYPFSLSAGTLTVGLDAAWRDGGADLAGNATLALEGAAGFYDDIAFTGLSTSVAARYDAQTGLLLEPASLAVALVDIGLPLQNITAGYRLQLDPAISADISDLYMEAFGGTVRADPFSFHTGAGSNHLVLHAQGINLAELLAVQDFEAISVDGTISADLPVTIGDDGITVTGGSVSGDAPGGRIRYNAADPGATATGALDVATRALSNFVFDALSSSVDYGEGGDLVLKMRLSGRNPDLESNRPVILNLSVESNIPEMLKSLQAARTVEEILEKRLAK